MRELSQPYLPEAAANSTGPIAPVNPISQTLRSPLDRRAMELSEYLKLLGVKVQSANSHLQGKQKMLDDLSKAHERRGIYMQYVVQLGTTEQSATNVLAKT